MTKKTDAADLRGKINDLDTKRLQLMAERDELSFAAVVERDVAAAKRVAEINEELVQLANEAAVLKAALSTATRREAEAAASERASQKRADLERAEALLPKVAEMAAQMDAAMKTLREASAAFEQAWSEVKRLSGVGPTGGAIKVHLGRACRSALRGLPGLQLEMVPPNERHSVSELTAGWSKQVSNVATAQNKSADEASVIISKKSAAKAA
jgi:hypothetical protein